MGPDFTSFCGKLFLLLPDSRGNYAADDLRAEAGNFADIERIDHRGVEVIHSAVAVYVRCGELPSGMTFKNFDFRKKEKPLMWEFDLRNLDMGCDVRQGE